MLLFHVNLTRNVKYAMCTVLKHNNYVHNFSFIDTHW